MDMWGEWQLSCLDQALQHTGWNEEHKLHRYDYAYYDYYYFYYAYMILLQYNNNNNNKSIYLCTYTTLNPNVKMLGSQSPIVIYLVPSTIELSQDQGCPVSSSLCRTRHVVC
jgi:hypothetical protein